MTKYTKKPETVYAVQWTGDNIDEVREICPGVFRQGVFEFGRDLDEGDLMVPSATGLTPVQVGAYVVMDSGKFKVVPEKCFLKTYSTGSAEDRLAELESRYKYAMADIQNLKKRFSRERTEFIRTANEELDLDILKILDDIDRALMVDDGEIRSGVELVRRNILRLLNEEGCEPIDCKAGDDFDSNFHEAMMTEKSEFESGKVSKVLQTGWLLGGKLLRPAKVSVSE